MKRQRRRTRRNPLGLSLLQLALLAVPTAAVAHRVITAKQTKPGGVTSPNLHTGPTTLPYNKTLGIY